MVLLMSMTLSFEQRSSLSPSGTVLVTTTCERQLLLIVSTADPYVTWLAAAVCKGLKHGERGDVR